MALDDRANFFPSKAHVGDHRRLGHAAVAGSNRRQNLLMPLPRTARDDDMGHRIKRQKQSRARIFDGLLKKLIAGRFGQAKMKGRVGRAKQLHVVCGNDRINVLLQGSDVVRRGALRRQASRCRLDCLTKLVPLFEFVNAQTQALLLHINGLGIGYDDGSARRAATQHQVSLSLENPQRLT